MSEAVFKGDGGGRAARARGPAAQRASAKEHGAIASFARAEALFEKGAAPANIVRELVQFVGGAPDRANANECAFVLRQAHAAFREGLRQEAVTLYDWLARNGQRNTMCEIRRAMWRQQNNDPQTALRILEGLEASRPLDDRAVLVKARALVALERFGDAVAPLKFVLAARPGKLEVVRMLFMALERAGDKSDLHEPEKFLEGVPHNEQFEFLLQARLACEDYIGAAKLCSECPNSIAEAGLQRIGQVMHAQVVKRDFETVDALFDAAGGVASQSHSIIGAKLRALLIRKDLEAAERILREAEPLLRADGAEDLRLRNLKYFCLSMQLDRAVEYLHECTASAQLPAAWTATVAGLYSARREWDKILDLMHDRVRLGFDIAHTATLEAVGRAVRHTGRYKEVLELLDNLLTRAPNEELSNFRDRLIWETSLAAENGSHSAARSAAEGAIANRLYSERARVLTQSLSARRFSSGDRTVYFCTDINYFAGTCVAMFSLLRNNCMLCGACSFNVVCADDAVELATDIFAKIGAAFGVPIGIVPASELFGTAGNFKSDWGLFAPSHGLSDAAYYRIFMAQNLLARGIGGRALYIDSDTCVGHGVDRIFEFDMKDKPIAARPEILVPEIARAAAILGVEPARYFNSGVLLFDLAHHDLPAALARTVEIARDQQELLTFVDQCALNLAFRDCYTPLAERFNWLLRPTAPQDAFADESVILHFIARPKPWDPMYANAHCMRWVREYVMLSELLPQEMSRRLLASQFANFGTACSGEGA